MATATPDWLERIVEAQTAVYGLPAPAIAPAVWPEAQGRGVLISDPGTPLMTNAETVRFMAPGISPARSGGYMRYTDEHGAYVDPSTGWSRFATESPEPGRAITPAPLVDRPPQRWEWPSETVKEARIDRALPFILGKHVADIYVDHLGWRVVLERGDGPAPRIYIDLDGPHRQNRDAARLATAHDPAAAAGNCIERLNVSGPALDLGLSDGATLRSSAHEAFESWQIVVADVGLWVCLPGGSLAEFSFRP